MELKQSDTINRYDKEMKSQEEIKHFQESAALFYKDARKYTKKMLKEERIIKGET